MREDNERRYGCLRCDCSYDTFWQAYHAVRACGKADCKMGPITSTPNVSCYPEALAAGAGEKQQTPYHFEAQNAGKPERGILNERGSTHGDFKENGQIMQALKEAMRSHFGWEKLEPYEREALEMIQHKIGRILCGNHKFYDHWRDIAGYAKLVEERCPKPEETKK